MVPLSSPHGSVRTYSLCKAYSNFAPARTMSKLLRQLLQREIATTNITRVCSFLIHTNATLDAWHSRKTRFLSSCSSCPLTLKIKTKADEQPYHTIDDESNIPRWKRDLSLAILVQAGTTFRNLLNPARSRSNVPTGANREIIAANTMRFNFDMLWNCLV